MTTIVGPWEGHARMRIEYTRTYNSDHTQARYDGSVYIEFDVSVSDSTNTWRVESPHFTDDSGSNLNISIGSGGGTKKIKDFDFYNDGDGEIYAEVAGIEYIGQTVEHTFTLDSGALAPFFNNTNYSATSITSSSFTTTGISGDGNGGTLNNLQVQYNTSASSTGAFTHTEGNYSNATIGSLTRDTTYYFRVRFSNSTYGYGEWGPWKSFTTLSTIPAMPGAGFWTITNITQTTAEANPTGSDPFDNGGNPITKYAIQYNTSQTDVGAGYAESTTTVPDMTGLAPGTTYYARIRAANLHGWGAYSSWKSFTTLPGVSVKVGGVWKSATPYVRVNGIWKPAVRYVKVGGIWKA